jgi:hypothetical protein
VHHDERIALKNAHQMPIPAHPDAVPEQRERHGIERTGHFDVPIGVDGALAGREEGKRVYGERLQGPLLDFDEVRPDLATRRAVNAKPGDRPIPVPQKRVVRIEAVKAAPLERIGLDVPAAALLLPIFLWAPGLRRERREASVVCKREIDIVTVGVEEARAHHGCFQIVVTNDLRHPTNVAEGVLV